ncbi:MAG: hypothetical protein ABI539_00700 [Acidobacteriota bacterium]
MGVKQQMLDILRSPDTARINFSFKTTDNKDLSIDGEAFVKVANALAADQIKVVEGRFNTDIAMYSASFSMGSDSNTFYLGKNPRWSRNFNALIVHESVHAFFDLTRRSMPWIDNEAAAYVAQGFYLRNSGYARGRLEPGSESSIGYLAVNELKDGGDFQYFVNEVRKALKTDPQYHSYINSTFTGDG